MSKYRILAPCRVRRAHCLLPLALLLAATKALAATPQLLPAGKAGSTEGTTILAAAEAAPADPHEPQPGEFNPWQGIDRNGRIPKVPLPPDIDHPERWRYIPEGRIKPGNVFQRLLVSSFIAPFVFRNGDVGTGFGIGLTDIDFRLQRRREFLGLFLSYTTKGQQRYGFVWRRQLKHRELATGGVIQEERSHVLAQAAYSKTLTRRFFGFGPDRKSYQESSYTDAAIELSFSGSYSLPKPVDDFVIDLGITTELHRLSDGTVQGVPSTRFVPRYFPSFREADDWNFGMLSSELRWDTRDSERNPYRGHAIGARMDASLLQTGWTPGVVWTIFASKIFPLPGLFHSGGDDDEVHPPTDSLAFGAFTQLSSGSLPFFLLPTLGGRNTLRGYIDGRWRDRAAWHAAAEYRFWVIPRGFPITKNIRIERVGLAAFYEAGSVNEDWIALFRGRVAQSYGVGGRVSLERSALFRADVGFSEDGYNFVFGFGLSF